jgi:hypothetical protein
MSTGRGASTTHGGQPFPPVPRLPPGHLNDLLARNRELGIDAETCEPGTGEDFDLPAAVEALLTISDYSATLATST